MRKKNTKLKAIDPESILHPTITISVVDTFISHHISSFFPNTNTEHVIRYDVISEKMSSLLKNGIP